MTRNKEFYILVGFTIAFPLFIISAAVFGVPQLTITTLHLINPAISINETHLSFTVTNKWEYTDVNESYIEFMGENYYMELKYLGFLK